MGADRMSDMAVLEDIYDKVPKLLRVPSPVLHRGADPIELRKVVPQERRRRQHVVVGGADTVVPEVVHVASENGLDARVLHLLDKPCAAGLVDVVVAAPLVLGEDIGRVVHEEKNALV